VPNPGLPVETVDSPTRFLPLKKYACCSEMLTMIFGAPGTPSPFQ